jgi:hypothetical protein
MEERRECEASLMKWLLTSGIFRRITSCSSRQCLRCLTAVIWFKDMMTQCLD